MSTVMEPPKTKPGADYTNQILNLVKPRTPPNRNSTRPSSKYSNP